MENISVMDAKKEVEAEFPDFLATVDCTWYSDWKLPSWTIYLYKPGKNECPECHHKVDGKEVAAAQVCTTFKKAFDELKMKMGALKAA